MESNETESVVFNQPKQWGERRMIAQTCCTKLNLKIPCVVDTIENSVDGQYASWPERIFVVDQHGMIAYAGKQGPWGFQPREAERALGKILKARN